MRERHGQHLAGRMQMAALFLAATLAACGGGEEAEQAATDTMAAPAEQVAAGPMTGEQVYQRCATCHQPDGKGLPGTYPPLTGSEYVTASNPAVPIRVVLHGLQGPITVAGTQYNSIMPAYGTGVEMSDEEVAAVLTYVRSSWGNTASPVTAQQVAAERSATRTSTGPATAQELDAMLK